MMLSSSARNMLVGSDKPEKALEMLIEAEKVGTGIA